MNRQQMIETLVADIDNWDTLDCIDHIKHLEQSRLCDLDPDEIKAIYASFGQNPQKTSEEKIYRQENDQPD